MDKQAHRNNLLQRRYTARRIPGSLRHHRAGCRRHPHPVRQDRKVHLRPRLPLHCQLPFRRSPISTATKACCCTAAIRSSNWRSNAISSKSAICCSTASCRTRSRRSEFVNTVTRHTMVHDQLNRFFRGFRRDAHPMAVMVGVVGALSAFYHDSLDINNPAHREISAFRLIAKMPTIAAMAYKYYDGPAVHVSAQFAVLLGELPAHDVRDAGRGIQGQRRCWCARWTASSSCMPITSRTPRRPPCGWPVRRAPIRSPASPPALPACGARRTAAPTKRR